MLASSGHPDCAKIVNPIDAPPTRSPLQVHTALARRFSGLSVIEVGTRNGDGAECWASAASKLYAVEMDHKYCGILRARSSKLPRGFEVLCTKFARIPPEILLSADYFTCAQPAVSRPRPQPPPLRLTVSASGLHATGWVDGATNSMFLNWLANRGRRALLKPGSMAAIMFDTRHNSDVSNLRTLLPYSAWSERVDFEECAACSRIVGAKGYKAESKWESCDRAVGTFVIAGFLLSHLPGNISKGPHPSLKKSNFTGGCSTRA